MKSLPRIASASKPRSTSRTGGDRVAPPFPAKIEVPPVAPGPQGPAMSIAEWGEETRRIVAQIAPAARYATLVINHGDGVPGTVLPVFVATNCVSPAVQVEQSQPGGKRARLMSCLIRMVSELDAVSASLATGGRMHGVMPSHEAKRLRDALDNAWTELVNAVPRAYPEELAEDFADR